MALTFPVPSTQLTTTLHNRRDGVVDQVMTGTPFMNAMTTHGGLGSEGGGKELVTPLRMAKNSAVGSFYGYDLLDNTPQDVLTSARYPWSAAYATVSVSWTEERENDGPGKLIDHVNQKITDAGDTLKDKMNIYFLSDQPSAGSKDPIALSEIIDVAPGADPPRTESIGNIGNANTWWRNQQTAGGAFTVADMNTMWNDCSDGIDPPTFLLTNQTVYEYYENSLTGLIRYGDSRTGDQGFDSLLYKKAPMYWDSQIGVSGAIYFINTKYLKICTHAAGDFDMGSFIEATNQAAMSSKIKWMGQMECSQRRRQGVLSGITAPA